MVFVDYSRHAVVEAGDLIEVDVRDTGGRLLAEKQITIEPKDLTNAFAIVNLRYNPVPDKTALLQNYPNPFNPDTWLPFHLAQDAPVTINIYNAKGQLIRAITLGNQNAGIYTTKSKAVYWDGRSSYGEKVASGIYYYTLQTGEFRATRKMVIMK